MKKILFLIILLSFFHHSFAQNLSDNCSRIDETVINRVNTLFFNGKYKECYDSCKKYLGYWYLYLGYNPHPYRDWSKIRKYWDSNDVEDVATMLYLGCLSAYKYSLTQHDIFSGFDGKDWAIACTAIYNDYLHNNIPNKNSSIEDWANYLVYAERAMVAAKCGDHFLSVERDDSWYKKQRKRLEKMSDRICETLYRNIPENDSVFSNYPILQYKIKTISLNNILIKQIKQRNLKGFQDIFKKRVEAFKYMTQRFPKDNIYRYELHEELNGLISILCSTVIENEFCKRAAPNYERFCMEYLIKLQDISFSLYGSNRYSPSPNYTLRDIQNSLKSTDCAILHFEAPIVSGQYYYKYDISTRYRNYALIITKDQETPDIWHRGYINDSTINDLSIIKDTMPNVKRFFYVGTTRMNAYIDIAGNDSSIVRLHSLSQLLKESSRDNITDEITFIGDLNYGRVGDLSSWISERKGGNFRPLLGPAKELAYIKSLFTNVHSICGDDATRNIVTSEISRTRGIVHISTHGDILDTADNTKLEDLLSRKDNMNKSCIILSGYNDAPNSLLVRLSANDVMNMKKINSSVVFLDACMLGRGEISVVGAVSMAEAFHLIGAQNVICYLEPIEDSIATDFSNRFYFELSKGASYHDAFYTAKNSINKKIKVVLWE